MTIPLLGASEKLQRYTPGIKEWNSYYLSHKTFISTIDHKKSASFREALICSDVSVH